MGFPRKWFPDVNQVTKDFFVPFSIREKVTKAGFRFFLLPRCALTTTTPQPTGALIFAPGRNGVRKRKQYLAFLDFFVTPFYASCKYGNHKPLYILEKKPFPSGGKSV